MVGHKIEPQQFKTKMYNSREVYNAATHQPRIMERCYKDPHATWLAQNNSSDIFIGWLHSGQNGVLTNFPGPETSAYTTTSTPSVVHPEAAQLATVSAFSYVHAMRIYIIPVGDDLRRRSPLAIPTRRKIATAICNGASRIS